MVSLENIQTSPKSTDAPSSPRISFSAEFLDEKNFISISPKAYHEQEDDEMEIEKHRDGEFEFLSSNVSIDSMLTADELFCEGKLLPFWQMHQCEKLSKVSLKAKDGEDGDIVEEAVSGSNKDQEPRVSWFVDDDPSPRPPKCTVLWKELLRLKKQRASSLSPSSSSSSTSSSSSSLADVANANEKKVAGASKEKQVKRAKKGLERTRSASIRIRPMINVPICTAVRNNPLPPLLLKRGKLER